MVTELGPAASFTLQPRPQVLLLDDFQNGGSSARRLATLPTVGRPLISSVTQRANLESEYTKEQNPQEVYKT